MPPRPALYDHLTHSLGIDTINLISMTMLNFCEGPTDAFLHCSDLHTMVSCQVEEEGSEGKS